MQKRVGIARAIALNPSFLFCDEPNYGLDPYTSILDTDCQELRDFVCANTLARNIIEGKGI